MNEIQNTYKGKREQYLILAPVCPNFSSYFVHFCKDTTDQTFEDPITSVPLRLWHLQSFKGAGRCARRPYVVTSLFIYEDLTSTEHIFVQLCRNAPVYSARL